MISVISTKSPVISVISVTPLNRVPDRIVGLVRSQLRPRGRPILAPAILARSSGVVGRSAARPVDSPGRSWPPIELRANEQPCPSTKPLRPSSSAHRSLPSRSLHEASQGTPKSSVSLRVLRVSVVKKHPGIS